MKNTACNDVGNAATRARVTQARPSPTQPSPPAQPSPPVVSSGQVDIHSSSSVTRKAAERFWAKVNFQPGDSCWEWMGEINHRGYGRFVLNGVNTTAHRVAYDIANGPVPEGLQCGHLCHNKPCVRPDHLEAMTAKENIRQRDERMGRKPGSALTRTERNRRYWARKKERRAQEHLDSGWWVSI